MLTHLHIRNYALISHLDIDFHEGFSVMTGETGAGKSTMMRLMLALLSPQKGEVVMYSEKASVHASPQTRCNIVYVPQGNTLMSGTIRENLLLGDPAATEEDLKDVLHLAAADFVFDLPDGMDSLCGEKGAGLSEGQAQRICIARSLLRKGGVLLLDEPTAALDPQTEEILLKRLMESAGGRTLIIVTHREAAVSVCGNVVRL
jgi:ABC-type bacteriocin/lantibiotic exporter with double-glycine peptidase domain